MPNQMIEQDSEPPVLRHQNAHMNGTSIDDLPAELLCEIFRICISAKLKAGRSSHSWLWIGHVCRHWREVALQTAWLWTRIALSDSTQRPERALEMLARSSRLSNGSRLGPRNWQMPHRVRASASSQVDREHSWVDDTTTAIGCPS